MAVANYSSAVPSRRAKYDDDFRVPALLGAQPLDLAARVRQRTTHNIDMAIGLEEERKPGYLQFALPMRAKTRRQTITPNGTPRPLCQSDLGRMPNDHFLFPQLLPALGALTLAVVMGLAIEEKKLRLL